MDSVPLSTLLDDLLGLQNEVGEMNWIEALCYANNEEIINNTNIHSSSSSETSDTQDGNSDKQDSSPEYPNKRTANPQYKRKRQEVKSKCEAKRRNRFNEQLEMLRSILSVSSDQKQGNNNASKLTREALMGSAIQEILNLRLKNQMLLEAQNRPMKQSLVDPFNRESYSAHDLERAFKVMFARQLVENYTLGNNKTSDAVMYEVRMLQDVSNQIGKPEHQLSVSLMEQMLYSLMKFTPKELSRCIERNWNTYKDYQKDRRDGIVLYGAEAGAWILNDMMLLEYATGNLEGFERTNVQVIQYLKKLGHTGTAQFFLANSIGTFWGSVSVPLAKRICDVLEGTVPWGPFGKVRLAASLIAVGKQKEGLDITDRAISEMLAIGKGKDTIHLYIAPTLLSLYIQTGTVDKGLALADYVLKKFAENDIEAYLGKPEVLRQKANLLLLKKHPGFVPEPVIFKDADSFVQQILDLSGESEPKVAVPAPSGPLELAAMTSEVPEASAEDIESTFRAAMELSRARGLTIVELRCAVDLVRYFIHIGAMQQAAEGEQVLKDALAKIRGCANTGELQRARIVMSMVRQFCDIDGKEN